MAIQKLGESRVFADGAGSSSIMQYLAAMCSQTLLHTASPIVHHSVMTPINCIKRGD